MTVSDAAQPAVFVPNQCVNPVGVLRQLASEELRRLLLAVMMHPVLPFDPLRQYAVRLISTASLGHRCKFEVQTCRSSDQGACKYGIQFPSRLP